MLTNPAIVDELLTTGVWRASQTPTGSSGVNTVFSAIVPTGRLAVGWYFTDGGRHVQPDVTFASAGDIVNWVLGDGAAIRSDGRLLCSIGNGYVRADMSGTLHTRDCCHVAAFPTPASPTGMTGCTAECRPFETIGLVFAQNEHVVNDIIDATLALMNP